MANYNFTAVQAATETWNNNIEYKFQDPEPNSLTMYSGGTEMIRVAPDGFYVRGVRVPADDKEATTVYNAFKQFLVWSELNRR
jgi:hypothetical protein